MEKLWQFIKGHIKGFWSGVVGGCVLWGYVLFPLRIDVVNFPAWVVDALGFAALTFSTAVLKVVAEHLYEEYGKRKVTRFINCIKYRRNEKRKKDKQRAA